MNKLTNQVAKPYLETLLDIHGHRTSQGELRSDHDFEYILSNEQSPNKASNTPALKAYFGCEDVELEPQKNTVYSTPAEPSSDEKHPQSHIGKHNKYLTSTAHEIPLKSENILERLRSEQESKILQLRAEYQKCLAQLQKDPELRKTRWHDRISQTLMLLGHDDLSYASVGTVKDSKLGEGSTPLADAVVWYMTAEEFTQYSRENPKSLEKPIVIPSELEISPEELMARFLDAMKVSCARNFISVQDLGLNTLDKNGKPVDTFIPVPTSTVLDRLKKTEVELSNDKEALPYNLLDLQDFNLVNSPSFLNEPRYQLLRLLDERIEADTRQSSLPKARKVQNPTLTPGKKHFQVQRPSDIASCQRFTIFAQRGSYSGPHADSLNGTWVQCLTGLKLWVIFPNLQDDDEQARFEVEGSEWIPSKRGDAQIIMLTPGDILIMPAGEAIIHAPITVEDSLMVGGMYWDTLTITSILGNISWILENPATSNERNLQQLPAILNSLNAFVYEFPERFVNENGDVDLFLSEWNDVYQNTTKSLQNAIKMDAADRKPTKSGRSRKRKYGK